MKKIIIGFLLLMSSCDPLWAAPPTRQVVYEPNETILSADVSSNENVIFNYLQAGVDTIADGSIVNADLSASANIQADKLNLTSIVQNIANTGTFTNTGNATVTGTLSVSSTVTANSVTFATLPAGAMMAWPTTTAPNGWLLCDGSAVSRTTYSGLFAVISTTFGAGDSSTTFNVPNAKGKFLIGLDGADTDFDAMGETGGAKTHTLTTDEMPAHTHTIPSRTSSSAGSVQRAVDADNNTTQLDTITSSSAGGGAAHSIVNPYIVTNFIIKY